MLINGLVDYYDVLAKENKVIPKGYSKQEVHFTIFLNENGTIDDIISCQKDVENKDKKGKTKIKSIPKEIYLPKRTEKSTIDLNIIDHRPLYIFGLNFDKKSNVFTADDATNKAKKSHDIFVEGNFKFIEGLQSDIINAYRKFLLNWNAETEADNPVLQKIVKKYGTCYFEFGLSGHPDILLHQDKELKEKWEKYYKEKCITFVEQKGICCISGKVQPVARIHGKIKGLFGGQSSGGVLVGVNNPSEESYTKTQGFNACVSQECADKYVEVLNYLLKDNKHHSLFDNMTVVYWCVEKDAGLELDLFQCFGDSHALSSEELNGIMQTTFQRLKKGQIVDLDDCNIDKNSTFYIVGFVPNSSRIAVQFLYKDTFGHLFMNVLQHQKDMMLEHTKKQISIRDILKELVSPKSSEEKVPPSMIANLLKSILLGKDYSGELLATVVKRIKVDSDTDKNTFVKINTVRIGIIKACINRKNRMNHQKGEMKMALDTTNKDKAYLCGRLFAVLEKMQKEASDVKLNRTIRDSYFGTVCSNPAIVFPKLLKLAQNHFSKITGDTRKEKLGYYFNSQIGEIINGLDGGFPQTFNLIQQGTFIVGYYQEMYHSKAIEINEENQEND